MIKTFPEHFRADQSVMESMIYLVGKTTQVGVNLEVVQPEELRLRLEQLCIATERTGAFVNLVNKWCDWMPPDIIDQIPTWVLLDAETNSKR